MRNLYLCISILTLFSFLLPQTRLHAQASACPAVNAGPDVTVCQGQCTNLNATIQGTVQTTSYTVGAIPYSPYSYTTGTTVLNNIDDRYTAAINLPFCFQFFGNTYTQIVIGSNGVISFNTGYASTGSGYLICGAIPTNCGVTPLNSIMAPYHDIDPSIVGNTADLRYQTYGTYPCREFVVSWYNVPMYYTGCNNNVALNATQQVVLHENTNIIDIYIQNKQLCPTWNGGYAIEGIQNATGTVAYVVPGRNVPTQWTAVNDGYRFIPAGAPNYTIQWLDPLNNVISSSPTVNVCPATSGSYTAVLTNATCSGPIVVNDVVNVTVSNPTVTANNGGPYCPGQTINLTASAGGVDYDWTGPAGYNQPNTQNPTIPGATAAMSGVYTVTMTNAAGCTVTGTTTVVVGSPTATAGNTGPYCTGAAINLTSGAGGIDYDWTGPSGYNQPNTQNPTIPGASGANAGTYTVTVTFTGGCTATATTSVVVNPTPSPTANNTGPYCAGGTIQLNSPTGSATDDWTGPGGYTQANTQNPTIPGSTTAMSGVYTVTVTNAAGCSATATTSVVVNPAPTPTANNTGPYCVGATIQLNSPTGSATDDWAGPGGYTQANTQNPTIPSATAAMSGVYTVTVTNAAGCSATATTSVVVNPNPTPTANNTGPYCVGATIQLNSPTGSVTDDWAGPGGYTQANTQNPTIPSATTGMSGVYTVTVTNAAGCSATATTSVVVNPNPTPTANNTGPYCPGATIQLNSPTGSATDDWTGPGGYTQANTQNPTILSATTAMSGVYTVTVTNAAGCSATATTNVVVNPNPTPTANNTGPYCVGATIQLNSPTGSATDDWTGPGGYTQANTQNPTIPSATAGMSGVYTVTVTSAAGCSATATTTVVVNTNPTPTANNTGPYCVGATIQLNSPTGSATDDWAGPGGYTQANTQNPTRPGSTTAMSGVYTVTVTNAAGCSATATTSVVVNPNPTPTANNTGPYCPGATIQLNSPTGSATDDWTGPGGYTQANTQNPTIPSATTGMSGVYTVTVTNAAGCSATATTSVVVNPNPTPTANNTGPYCVGATIQLNSPTGSATDDWAGPGGYAQANTQNPTIPSATAGMSGVYTVTVTSAAGCSATATTTVVVNPNPTPTANNTGPYCAGATIQLNSPTGLATDDWAGPGGYTQANTQNPTRPGSTTAMSGVYTVTVTNAAGCSATATTSVVVNANPTPTANNTGPYCPGATIQLNSPTGSATDDWAGPGGYTQANTQNPTIPSATTAMSGVYTVTVTNAAGCSATATTSVVVNPSPTPTATNTGPYCIGNTIQLNSPTGSATDDWAGPGGYTQANTQNPTIPGSTPAMSGVYTVTVTNAAGCSATATTTVVVNTIIAAVANNTGPYCVGATIQLNSPSGFATDDWTGPAGYTQANNQNPTIVSATTAMSGVYTVTVTNAAGCSATATTSVVVNANPTPTANNTGPYCAGATIQLNSPTGSATDDWAGPGGYTQANTQNPTIPGSTPAMSGVYTVTVTNAAGCSTTATTSVVVNANPTPTATNTGPYCAGTTIQLNSPTGSATDDWAGPGGYTQANTQNPTIPGSTPAMSGVYTVTVTNAAGCSSTATTTVAVNANPAPTANNTGPYCAGTTIQLNSPLGSATDDWAGPGGYTQANTQNPTIVSSTPAMSGVYTVTVTNAAGCSTTATTTVLVNANPAPTANNTGPYCAGTTIQLNSPVGSATDDWAGPGGYAQANTQNPTIVSSTPAMSGVYTVTVTNAAGCSATATTSVVVNANPTPTANNTGPYCAGTTIQLNSPTGSATDDWAGPGGYTQANTQNPTRPGSTPAMSGVYTVTVTNAAGCSTTATTSVVVNANPTPTANNTGPYCAGATIQLNSPTGSATDDWAGPGGYTQANTQNPTILSSTPAMSGVYTVTVTNAAGCSTTATTSVVVNANPAPTANNTGPYCAGTTIQLNSPLGSATDDWAGPGGYTQANTQNPTIVSSTPAMSGVYTVTVTNAAGCSTTATTSVVVNANPAPTANNTGPYCAGTTIQLNSPTGSATDDWAGPGGYTQANTQNPTIVSSTPAMSGVYTVTVTNAAGCSTTATTSVVVNANPTPTANNTGPYCVGTTIQLNSPTGSATDDWAGPAGYTQANTQNPTIVSATLAMAGTYTVTVTNAAGCSTTVTTSVVVNANPTPTANNTGPYCEGSSIQLNSPTGSATDDWAGPAAYTVNNVQNPTIAGSTLAMTGIYTVTVTNAAGCSATATTSVTVNANPTPTANNTGPYCAGTTIQLNSPTGSATDDWAGPAGYVANNVQNPSIATSTPAMSGVYTVTVTNAAGCSTTATTSVTVNALPNATASNNTPICENQALNLTSGGGVDFDWTGPSGFIVNNTQNPGIPSAPISAAGVYTVTVTDANGCISTATTTAVINSNLVFTASSNSPLCEGDLLTLGAQNIPTASYNWTGPNGFIAANQQNPTIASVPVVASGTYTVLATNGAGCTGSATVNVVVNPRPVAQFAADNLSGCAPMCVNFTDQSVVAAPGTITTWLWNVEAQDSSATPNVNFCFNNPGIYDASITVTSADGCSATLSVPNYITVSANPVAEFTYAPQQITDADAMVNFGNESTGAVNYSWDFGDGTGSTDMSPNHVYADSGTFCITLLATAASGCFDTTVHCLLVKPEFSFYIPNTFTVNEDGLNEIFTAHGRGIKSFTARIFNRWGEEIYYFNDINKGWPGTRQNGEPCQQGVYVYRIDIVDGKNKEHEYIGNVNLIR